MKFGLLTEGDTPKGMTHYHRFHELLDEIKFAEDMGFDFWGSSEQHGLPTVAPISAPETLYAAVAMRTNRIKLRHMSILMLKSNHPVRIAERLATLDILSHGRVELSTARSNSPITLDTFGIEASETREQWREGLDATIRALTEDPFQYDGKYYKVEPVSVTPKLYRDKLFPVSVIASSKETFEMAGKAGLGVITNDSYLGWDWVEDGANIYKKAIQQAEPFAPYAVNNTLSFSTFTTNCDVTREKAIEKSAHVAKGFFSLCEMIYTGVAAKAGDPDSSYASGIAQIVSMAKHRDDIEYMSQHTPSVMVGTPDDIIEQVKKLQNLGYDEVIFRIDGFGHEQNKRAIELIGKYVIPEFKSPKSPVWENEYERDYGVPVPSNLL
jgi:alkanesulfonate monooxygenase SsuD/methylene tetrahydromethanopterin reductase-like flavin-dependent oxidoreductase (luciferase family)